MDHNHGRRGHFHRGRRGPDRRGPDRRQGPPAEQPNRAERGERVDVEQIMREIRSRIAQRSGIDLTNQQIHELAARRLEAILDPRGLKPELLEQLRRSAGERTVAVDAAAPGASAESYPFDEASLYDSPNAFLRVMRKLFNPILRMLFNPTPIAAALAKQSRLNSELLAREAEHDRRQTEWNALHYEILQRLALEVSRASIDAQSLSLRAESLSAKVDFNERRVRAMEGTQVQARPQRPQETGPSAAMSAPAAAAAEGAPQPPAAEGQGDVPRRRRRRRRGRRAPGTGAPSETGAASTSSASTDGAVDVEDGDADTDEGLEEEASPQRVAEPAPLPVEDIANKAPEE
jgi:hypothetical protein